MVHETTLLNSHYNGALRKKFAVFLISVQVFRHKLGRSKEEEYIRCVRSFAKAEGEGGEEAVAFAKFTMGFGNRLLLAIRLSAAQS